MSGGEWDYVYSRLEEVASELEKTSEYKSCCLLRRALGAQVRRISVAMYHIEWVDSGDSGPGDEKESLEKCFESPHAAQLEVIQLEIDRLNRLISQMRDGKL